MNAWDSLPNGKHIDAVLDLVRTVSGPEWAAAWAAARDAASALVAWDYAGDLFTADLSVVELAAHGGDTAAILLLPIKIVMAKHNGENHEST